MKSSDAAAHIEAQKVEAIASLMDHSAANGIETYTKDSGKQPPSDI